MSLADGFSGRTLASLRGLVSALVPRRAMGFHASDAYWERRYREGGDSGAGSYGVMAATKAQVLNRLVEEKRYSSVLELGCGDGNQLREACYPAYVGVDVSPSAVERCRELYAGDGSKRFIVSGEEPLPTCDLGLSLDVIYHLVEDEVFESYMEDLLTHSRLGVVLYTSDSDVFVPDRREPPHIRHRPVQRWMSRRPDWRLAERIPNPRPWCDDDPANTSFADFYVFERVEAPRYP